MCRHLAYVGPPIALTHLLRDAPHGLVHQAQHPLRQTSGTANPDGYGIAWYEAGAAEPRRHRSATPIWADPELMPVAEPVRSSAVLGAARLASPGSPVDVSGNAPFIAERFSFSLNGIVNDWHDGIGTELRKLVSPRRGRAIAGVTDGETLFGLVLDLLDQGAPPADALAGVVTAVEEHGSGRLNLLLTDGATMAATACGNSLFTCQRDGAAVIASEPIDADPSWTQVPDRTVVTATATAATRAPL
jgi:gamma-glutamyl hercynylcysteine S-oxide hydrolase